MMVVTKKRHKIMLSLFTMGAVSLVAVVPLTTAVSFAAKKPVSIKDQVNNQLEKIGYFEVSENGLRDFLKVINPYIESKGFKVDVDSTVGYAQKNNLLTNFLEQINNTLRMRDGVDDLLDGLSFVPIIGPLADLAHEFVDIKRGKDPTEHGIKAIVGGLALGLSSLGGGAAAVGEIANAGLHATNLGSDSSSKSNSNKTVPVFVTDSGVTRPPTPYMIIK